jgi:hypothetical protein
MMHKLNRTRPFGVYKGTPFIPPGGDRVAVYTQDDLMFDVNDRLIEPGVSLAAARARRRQVHEHDAEAAAELIAAADKMAPALWKSMAKILLGAKNTPAKKADIMAALKEIVARHKAGASIEDDDAGEVAPAAKAPEVNGHTAAPLSSIIGAKPAAKPQPAKAPPPSPQRKGDANVNLAAWGRGKENYPFHDIRTAIEAHLGVSVTDAPAALEALIDKGVIAFKDARADLLPPPVEVEDHQDA